MINISTKNGDAGQTSLANGKKLTKADIRFDVIGDLDELNSWLGLAIASLNEVKDNLAEEKKFLLKIQDKLFVIGAELAKARKVKLEDSLLIEIEEHSEALQRKMAENWHTKFLLPGGSEQAARLDIARTVCRRAERNLVKLSEQQEVRPLLLKTLNRLSDYLYVLRCFVNFKLEIKEKVKS